MSEPRRTLGDMRQEMREVALRSGGDPEAAHSLADELLIEALRYFAAILPPKDPTLWPAETEDLIESFHEVKKWYA